MSPSHFGNLVLQYEVAAERIPRQLSHEPVVLVEISAPMGEDHLRLEFGTEAVDVRLHLLAYIGKVALPEIGNPHIGESRTRQKQICAAPGLLRSLAGSAQNDPMDLEFGILLQQTNDGPATADFYVIGVGAQAQHAAQTDQAHFQTSQGARPPAHNSSSSCLSRNVSIALKNPGYLKAKSSPSAINRSNVGPTRSSPIWR